jgi:hypothetical protein
MKTLNLEELKLVGISLINQTVTSDNIDRILRHRGYENTPKIVITAKIHTSDSGNWIEIYYNNMRVRLLLDENDIVKGIVQ